ncbi:hypothetical protein EX30DRAFT_330994 [Ascodesmis nigricans]|uniref:tRNA-dihydrouridine(20a/20b) synthase [NAD(P)+] n=1 Tax=Ascodesmis nigricans TaxID=341454 RepID=A0A4S2MXK6_9PEZI|nr:hypothetical protein EX30DRAFT_330994 [Ascodesmis nigricans]
MPSASAATRTTLPELPPRNPAHHPLRLLEKARKDGKPLFVSAPMVRYSKLPFRALVRDYGVDVCYTPMILAKEFVRHQKARVADFSTSESDRPLVVQFAASMPTDFARAAEMVMPYCDGVNLNCGCPQSWAIQEGVGCAMMGKPEDVAAMVKAVKERCGKEFCVSVKIRVHRNIEETLRFVSLVEGAGVDYITVHGRTRSQRSSIPPNLDAIRAVKQHATVPVLANGDVFTLRDALHISSYTGVDGVMAARGLLTNPCLFAGFEKTPWGALERFLDYAFKMNVPFAVTVHHVGEMMEEMVTRKERARMVENCRNIVQLVEWLDERFVLKRKGEEGWSEGVDVPRKEVHKKAEVQEVPDVGNLTIQNDVVQVS